MPKISVIVNVFKKLLKKEVMKKGSYLRKVIRFCGMKFTYGKELDITSILNAVVDITKVPQATGKLRKLQQADVLLLKIFHHICQKHKIPYALAYGNLLGAVRHKGFIPWDDDMDVWVLDEDYERTIRVVQQELKNEGFEFYGVDKTRLGDITFRISHKDIPGINLDIFYLFPSKYGSADQNRLRKHWNNVHKEYMEGFKKIKNNENKETIYKLRSICDDKYKKEIRYCSPEKANSFLTNTSVGFGQFDAKSFWPFGSIEFEGFNFSAPNDSPKVLESCYGDYMSFPSQFFWHNDLFTNFDDGQMEQVINQLQVIKNKLVKRKK